MYPGGLASCGFCHWAVISGDASVGIPDGFEECACLDVYPDFVNMVFDKLDTHGLDFMIEEVLPRLCGHFLDHQAACDHRNVAADPDLDIRICFICGKELS